MTTTRDDIAERSTRDHPFSSRVLAPRRAFFVGARTAARGLLNDLAMRHPAKSADRLTSGLRA